MYNEDVAWMGNVGDVAPRDSQGFLGVLGVSARALNIAGQIRT